MNGFVNGNIGFASLPPPARSCACSYFFLIVESK